MHLKDYLYIKDLSQAQFAEISGISAGTISQICKGKVPSPPLIKLIEIITQGYVTGDDLKNQDPDRMRNLVVELDRKLKSVKEDTKFNEFPYKPDNIEFSPPSPDF